MWCIRILGTFVCTTMLGMDLVAAWACMVSHNMFLFCVFLYYYKKGKWNPLISEKLSP